MYDSRTGKLGGLGLKGGLGEGDVDGDGDDGVGLKEGDWLRA